jgi:hypothetical protein
MPYTVFVADNFDFGIKDGEWYEYGQFETYEAALDAAHAIVNRSLLAEYLPGMTGEALFKLYKGGGEDPFIRPSSMKRNPMGRFRSPTDASFVMAGTGTRKGR